jgi:redox-sensing transcriptional repressor
MPRIDIPRKSIYRLSIYQRCLQRLKANRVDTVSSEALAKAAGVKSTQLRKDLTYFGQFGTRGLGYNVDSLSTTIGEVLGHNRLQPVVLVGGGFRKEGFEVVAAFDIAPKPQGRDLTIPILALSTMDSFIKEHQVKMAILTVPATSAQEVANALIKAGVQAILNFSPTVLDVPEDVVVNSVDLAVELENLSYFIR